MKIFLAGPHSHPGLIGEMLTGGNGDIYVNRGHSESTKVFLDRLKQGKPESEAFPGQRPFILESFYYMDPDTEKMIPYFGDFLLDSGAFTFMQQNGQDIDWEDYAGRYIDFINQNNIQKYIELDLDYIIGCEGARKLREMLESGTGRKSIPVWHPIRGKNEFLKMCDDYDYVALGGIVGKKWQGTEQYMPWFIQEAHKRGAKIHGLGFTKLTKLGQYHFDSVDSTAWTTGNRFGFIYFFDGKTMVKKNTPKGYRIANSRAATRQNYIEWMKFQKWADVHL